MSDSLSGVRAIITAGAAGIGRVTADLLAERGAVVHVCDVDNTALASIAASERITGQVADVADTAAIDEFVSAAIDDMGGLDLLVNNAGIAGPGGRVEELDPADVTHTLDVDVTSMFRTARRAVPVMREQRAGSIVNISSTAGLHGFPHRSAYAAAKWAVIGLTKTMAMELGEFGVRVNAICPGSISGPRMDQVVALEVAATGRDPDDVRSGFERQVSLRTFVDAAEIAETIAFLASPAASKITGQAIAVDGHTETLRNV